MVIETRSGTAFLGYLEQPTSPPNGDSWEVVGPIKHMMGALFGHRPMAINEPDNLSEAPSAGHARQIVVHDKRGMRLLDVEESPEEKRKRQLASRLLRAAMMVNGPNGRRVPRWKNLPGFSSADTWDRATAALGSALEKSYKGTYVSQEFGTLMELYEAVASRNVRLN
jgi:hypothetical protein